MKNRDEEFSGDPLPDNPLPLLKGQLRWLLIAALPIVLHLFTIKPVEPIFGGDSNRHVMTSVFFRDFLVDGQYLQPKAYAEDYFEQYPALGLLVWPPLFHAVCGAAMIAFGTSVLVARLLIMASLMASTVCVYRMTRRIVNEDLATLTAIVFSTLPIVFQYGRDVMLEMPTMAFVLISIDQFDVWLGHQKRRALYVAAVTAALAALTRFDAALLLPFYFLMLLFKGGWRRLLDRHVCLAALIAVCLVGPVYFVIVRQLGDLHMRQAAESVGGSVDGSDNGFLAAKNFWYYPIALQEQTGLIIPFIAIAGLMIALQKSWRVRAAVPLALLLATYITFTPLAELRARHAIYWLPSIAFFAVLAMDTLAAWLHRLRRCNRMVVSVAAYGLLLTTTAVACIQEPAFRVVGYQQAADYVLQNTSEGDRVFFDGWWDGNFTYYMRHLDDSRSRHVIRGDRLLYDFVCIPDTDFQAFAESEREMLQLLIDADPEFVVIEYPQFYERIETAEQLRELIHARPELFIPTKEIDVTSTLDYFPQFSLQIFRFDQVRAKSCLAAELAIESAANDSTLPVALPLPVSSAIAETTQDQ